MSPSDADIAWLAGLMDKRGTFYTGTARIRGNTYRYPRIVIRSLDEELIERVAEIFGTRVTYIRSNGSAQVCVHSDAAADWMRALRPWLSQQRRAQVDAILIEHDSRLPTNARRRAACREAAEMRKRDCGRFTGATR